MYFLYFPDFSYAATSLSYFVFSFAALSSYFFFAAPESFFHISEAFVVTSVIANPFFMSPGRSSFRNSIQAEDARFGRFSSL